MYYRKIVRQVGYLPELHEYAQIEKCKNLGGTIMYQITFRNTTARTSCV